MPWEVKYVPDREMVLAVATGVFYEEDAYAQVVQAIGLLQLHHARLVLVDHTEVLSEMRLSSLYSLPDYATELGAPWDIHVAVVTPRTRYRLETYEFFGMVSRNAGYDVRLFEDKEAAENWLLQSSSIPTAVR